MSGVIIGAFIALVGVIFNSIYTNRTTRDSAIKQYRANVIGKESIAWISEVRKLSILLLSHIEEISNAALIKTNTKINLEDIRKKDSSNTKISEDKISRIALIKAKRSDQEIAIKMSNFGMSIFKDADSLNLFLASRGYKKSEVADYLIRIKKAVNKFHSINFDSKKQYANSMNSLLTEMYNLKNSFEGSIAEILQKEWEKVEH